MERKKHIGKLSFVAGLFIGSTLLPSYSEKIMDERFDAKRMTSQYEVPVIKVYDMNHDGRADKTTIQALAMGYVPVSISREPTKEEINWYSSK